MSYTILIITFLVIFANNLIPIFGPPTWTILSFIAFNYNSSIPSLALFVLVGVIAASLARLILIISSRYIIRNKLLSKSSKVNINYLKVYLEKNKWIASSIFLADALSPLPSDQLFIAYGLTNLPVRYAIIPFFCGRIVTYGLGVYTAKYLSDKLTIGSLNITSFFSSYFILLEIGLLSLVYLFVKVDWKNLILNHKFRFIMKKN